MANTNAPFGFQQYSGTGSAPTYEQVTALIISSSTAAIFNCDPVENGSNGYIIRGTGSTTIAGVFVGCQYLSVSQKRTVWSNYWPGSDNSGDVTAYIVNDPNARFVAQSDGTGLTQAGVNANIGFAIGTGNTTSGMSGAYLDSTTIATTATLPFRVISLLTSPPGSSGTEAGAYNRAIVAFNSVATKQLTGI